MNRRLGLLLASLIFLSLPGACGKSRPLARSWPGAPAVVVSIDTLRSDHLPMYGYSGVETPALSSFRDEAILFTRAYSHVPLTLPSHGTIFTGALPAEHGLRDNLGYRLNAKLPTLAEVLKKAGYSTGGAVSSFVLNAGSGIARGFDFWEDSIEPTQADEALSRVQRPGAETEQILAKWFEAQPSDKPVFAFLHLYEPHTPYEPPEPYASRYRGREYDGEIAFADELVGRFFGLLKKKGMWDRALVIVLSDHGEGLGEHGEDEHGIFLYRWALQVPLMVKLPGRERAGTSVPTPVQLSDVFTTVVKVLGASDMPLAPGTLSLLDVAAGRAGEGRKLYAETLFPRLHFGWSDTASLIDGPLQYIEAPKPELYDLAKDPAEKENLAPGKPQAFRTLRIEMEKRRAGFTAPGTIAPEEARKLASLGYLSTGASPGSGPLPDAKDEIGIVRDLKTGSGYLHNGRYAQAVAVFQELLARNPRMLDVWDLQAQALQKMGRNEEALEALKKAIAASPESATRTLVAVANLCLRLARVEVERNHLPKALELLEKARAAGEGKEALRIQNLHFLRGDVLGRMGRLKEAEPEFLEEIRLFPKNLDAYTSLAALYASEGRLADVRETVRGLVAANPTPEAYARGVKALGVVGDRPGAETIRRTAALRFPSDPRFGGKIQAGSTLPSRESKE